jgi:hypothetical protein
LVRESVRIVEVRYLTGARCRVRDV